jgi:uncharacterized protein
MFNQYALVTGASEGLGKFLAIECAKKEMNLVLVALPGSSLHILKSYLLKTFDVDVLCIETDLSGESNCHKLYEEIKCKKISISVLINNAGIGGTFSFDEKETSYYTKLISLNVIAPTLLCRLFLSELKKNAPSFIMNVGSFSKSLRRELKKDNVSVSVLCPGGMNTSWRLTMENRMMGTWMSRQSVMEPSEVAAIGIRKMFQRKETIISGFWNRFFLFGHRLFPKRIKEYLVHYQAAKWKRTESLVPAFQPHLTTIKN